MGRSREEVERWAEEGKWSIRRAEAKKKKRESELSEIANHLSEAGLQDRRQSAIKQLSLCQRILQLAESGLNEYGKAGIDPVTLERFTHAVEKVQKIQNGAFAQLCIS